MILKRYLNINRISKKTLHDSQQDKVDTLSLKMLDAMGPGPAETK